MLFVDHEFPGKKDVMDFYFELRNFLNIYDLVDEHYVMYSELEADVFAAYFILSSRDR